MGCAPGFGAAFGNLHALGNLCDLLERIFHRNDFFQAFSHGLTEYIQVFFLNDKYHLVKSGLDGIVDGVVQDKFPVSSHRINLFQPAISASHTSRHNHQCHHIYLLLFLSCALLC